MKRFATSLIGFFGASLLATAGALAAADAPLRLVVDGRTVAATRPAALVRDGVAYVDLVRGVRAVDGWLRVEVDGSAAVTVDGRTLGFVVGRKSALLDAHAIELPGAPFVEDGDTFVPLLALTTLAAAKLTVDAHDGRALIALGQGDGYAAPVKAMVGVDDDIAPSPTAALAFATSGAIDAGGLHARVEITNRTDSPYVLSFPTARQVAFVLSRNGRNVWTSTDDVAGNDPSKLTIPERGTSVVTAELPDVDRFGRGRYLLRVRLMTEIPIDITPISLGIVAPESR